MQDAEVAGPGTKSVAREVWFGSGIRAEPSPPIPPSCARPPGRAARTRPPAPLGGSRMPSRSSPRAEKAARIKARGRPSGEAGLELADAGDRDPHRVAALQELRRGKADANAGRRAGRDEVAGLKRQPGRDRLDERRDVEDEVARVRVLAQLAVDPASDVEVLRRDLVGGRDPRPHRAEAVERLAEEPLLVVALPVARRHVVDDGVAEDMGVGVALGDVAPALADDERQLGLVVDAL